MSQTQDHTHKGHTHHDYTSSSGQQSSSDEDTPTKMGRVKQVGGATEDIRTEKKTRNKRSSEKKRKDSMATRPLPPIPNNDSKSSAQNKGAGSSGNTTPLPSTPSVKSVPTTPTISIPPPPPPISGVPPPPPAPPPPLVGSLPIGSNRPKTKRVNWDKLQGQSLEGTIWREVRPTWEPLEGGSRVAPHLMIMYPQGICMRDLYSFHT